MRERGVLLGKGGRWGNVLRIQPPLIFSSDDVKEFLKAFESSIKSL
jgi:4-aminobutyrate aminotransferase-like enzyme